METNPDFFLRIFEEDPITKSALMDFDGLATKLKIDSADFMFLLFEPGFRKNQSVRIQLHENRDSNC